jgi:hypothetical protein
MQAIAIESRDRKKLAFTCRTNEAFDFAVVQRSGIMVRDRQAWKAAQWQSTRTNTSETP